MPNAPFYNALNVSPDYNARRSDQMQNLAIAKQMRDDQIAQMQQRMKVMGHVSDLLTTESEVQAQMLPADAERFKAAHDKLMKPLVQTLQKYNNDPQMLQMMEPQALGQFERGLNSSEELRNAKENLKNFQLGTAAIQKGEMVDPVEIEYPGGTKETVPWHEAVDLHNQGIIKKLPFKSSMPMAELDPTKFLSHETPDADLKHKGYVGENYVADVIQAQNPRYTRDQAIAQAKLFTNPQVPGATNFIWGRRLPHTSGGGQTVFDKKGEAYQQLVFDRLNFINNVLPHDQTSLQQIPYNGGTINHVRIKPIGSKVDRIVKGKKIPTTLRQPLMLIDYVKKDSYGEDSHFQGEIPLPVDDPTGIQAYNKLLNVNRESSEQFVNPEDMSRAQKLLMQQQQSFNGTVDKARQYLESQGYDSGDDNVKAFLKNNPDFK